MDDGALLVSIEGRLSSKRCLSIETSVSALTNLPEQKFQCIDFFTYEQTSFAQLYDLNLCNSNSSINTVESLTSEQRLLIDNDKSSTFAHNDKTKKKSEKEKFRDTTREQLQKGHYELSMLLNANQMVSSKEISIKTLHRDTMQSRGITIPLSQVIEHRTSDYKAIKRDIDDHIDYVANKVLANRKRFMDDIVVLRGHVGDVIVLNSRLATTLAPFVANDNKLKKNMLKGGIIAVDLSLFSANKFSENDISCDNYILLHENEDNGCVELLENERRRIVKTLLFTLRFKFGNKNGRYNDMSLTLNDIESGSNGSPDMSSHLNPIFQHIHNRKQENMASEMFSIFKNGCLHKKNCWNVSKSTDNDNNDDDDDDDDDDSEQISYNDSIEDYILNIDNNFFIEDNNTIHSFGRNHIKISLSQSVDLSISLVPLQSVPLSARSKSSKVVKSLVGVILHLKECLIRKILTLHEKNKSAVGNKTASDSKHGFESKRGEIETEIEKDFTIINSAKYILRSQLNFCKMNLFIPYFIGEFKKLNICDVEIVSSDGMVNASTVLTKSQSSFKLIHNKFSELDIKVNEYNIQLCNLKLYNKSIVPGTLVSVSSMLELKSVLTKVIIHNYIFMKIADKLDKKKLSIQNNTDNSFHVVDSDGESLCCVCFFSSNDVVYVDISFAESSRGDKAYKAVQALRENKDKDRSALLSVNESNIEALVTLVEELNKA